MRLAMRHIFGARTVGRGDWDVGLGCGMFLIGKMGAFKRVFDGLYCVLYGYRYGYVDWIGMWV